MPSMIDACCSKCGRRFGWCGTMKNMPACPKCGHRPPQKKLDAEEAKMQEARILLATHPKNASAKQLVDQRVSAGLTLHQAAEQLGTSDLELRYIEYGYAKPSEELAQKIAEVYGVGESNDA